MSTKSDSFTISNIAGGDERSFRIRRGTDGGWYISDAAVRHARRIGFGGPRFSGPAADDARAAYERNEDDRFHAGL